MAFDPIRWRQEDIDFIVAAYRESLWTLTQIAEEFDVDQRTIRKVLVGQGIPIRKRGPVSRYIKPSE